MDCHNKKSLNQENQEYSKQKSSNDDVLLLVGLSVVSVPVATLVSAPYRGLAYNVQVPLAHQSGWHSVRRLKYNTIKASVERFVQT
jgi:hypothetical protein